MNNPAVFLSLGSNMGDRKKNISSALRNLEEAGVSMLSVSSFYETEPLGNRDQPPFINIVCKAETSLSPFDLLELCQKIEIISGRTKKGDGSPRVIDIDILQQENTSISSERLTLPHPAMYRRNFVLIPLREIEPGFINPETGQGIDQLIRESGDTSWVILSG